MEARFTRITFFGLIACLTGCSSLDWLNFMSGSGRFRQIENQAYGSHPRQVLDIYAPAKNKPSSGCNVVFVYGGNWREGTKNDYGFVGAALARHGHKVFIPDYRLYPEVQFPEFVADIALSVAWIQAQKNTKQIVLMGHSAGAMITALLSYDRRYLDAVAVSPDAIAAYIGLAGPHDYFLPTEEQQWVDIFGSDQNRQVEALSVRHVSNSAPQTLILHGEKDDIVTPRSATSLAQQLKNHNIAHDL